MLKFIIKSEDILNACKDSEEEAKKALSKGVGDLAKAAQRHILELADAELSPALKQVFRGQEKDHNIHLDTIDVNTHVITLTGSAYFIEEGIPANTPMATDEWLFKSKSTKISKKGIKYLYVPFQHSKAPSTQTGYEKGLTDRVKFELKARNRLRKAQGLSQVPWAGIETDKQGKPKEGLVHEFKFKAGKAKSNWTSDPLERLRVYQAIEKDSEGRAKLGKNGKPKVTRSWMTFRTATSNSTAQGKFIHPGFTAKKFMDDTADWAEQKFYSNILPAIFAQWKD